MLAIYLGRPLHGKTEQRDRLPDSIEVVLEEHVSQRHGGAFGFSIERVQRVTITCRRLRTPMLPDDVGVYSVGGYVPLEEDAALVQEAAAVCRTYS